ncbi:hypothetical protein [Arenimonas sp.]|uniref:hypothetical protein n=1 Tax=Arenimonas sp. TaxID=1872635 RepID=UPI0039E5CDF5
MKSLVLSIAMLPAVGVSAMDSYNCRNGLFPAHEGDFTLARVASTAKKTHFRADTDGCPQASRCIEKTYLVPGDEVLVAQQEDGWACAWYFGKKREFVGYLPQRELQAVETPLPKREDWIGRWKPIAGDNVIEIRAGEKNLLRITGDATWIGAKNAAGEPNVHVGQFEATGVAKGRYLQVRESADDYACRVDMQLVAGRLVVHDNGFCGGENVRFDNVYRKAGS